MSRHVGGQGPDFQVNRCKQSTSPLGQNGSERGPIYLQPMEKSYGNKLPEKYLITSEKKNHKYLEVCLQRRIFCPFSVLADGLLGVEA